MESSIVNSAAQQLGSLLGEEGKLLYKVQRKIEKLGMELEWMECFLEDAYNRQHYEKLVRKWVVQITDFAYEAEDILERYLHQVPSKADGVWNNFKWFLKILCTCRVSTVHDLGSNIDKLTVEISELNKRLKRYGVKFMKPMERLQYNAMMREERRIYSHVEEEAIGLENNVKEAVEKLTNTQVKVVSIIGMGGLGKSTLARKVFLNKAVEIHFNKNCAWVYISREFSRRNVFEEILSELSGSGKDEDVGKSVEFDLKKENVKVLTEGELSKKIQEVLQNKKYFMVLDDIWTTAALDSSEPTLGLILKDNSRNQKLLQHVDSGGHSHLLEPLSEENSWKLLECKLFPQSRAGNKEGTSFEDKTENNATVAPESSSNPIQYQTDQDEQVDDAEKSKMETLDREMLKHCHGLPLAIVALRGILSRKKTSSEWKEVKENISAYLTADTGDGGENDFKISTKRLYHLWEAEGILATKDESEAQGASISFHTGERYLLELIQRSMVQAGERWPSGRIKTCRVHDLMRDLCIKKCKEVSFLNIQQVSADNFYLQSIFADGQVLRKKVRRCVLHLQERNVESTLIAQNKVQAPHVRSLLFIQLQKYGTKISNLTNLVKCFLLLRVLDAEDSHSPSILKVGHLIHLRYLKLRNVCVKEVSSCIWDLKYLLILDLRLWGNIVLKLPKKFDQMERLKHLYLPREYESNAVEN